MTLPPAIQPSTEIVVAGFHRSGTSSVTQLLHAGGVFVGDSLIGAARYNRYGHYEDREVVRIHETVLADNGRTWQAAEDFIPQILPERWQDMEDLIQRRRARHRLWGFKDPRVCLFLPAWKHLMPNCKVVICFRDVADCSYSLSRRHALELFDEHGPSERHRAFFDTPDLAAKMWLTYNRALLSFARRYPDDVVVIGFDSMLAGAPLTRLIRLSWGAPVQEIPTLSVLDPLVTQSRDNRQPLADQRLAAQLDETFAELRALERRTLDRSAG